MATVRTYGWFSIAKMLALVALLVVILVAVVPGVPEWLLLVGVGLLAVAILFHAGG